MLYYVSIFSVFLPLVIGLIYFKHLEANAKMILGIVAFASVPQLATILQKDQPVILYNGYIIIDALLWAIFYIISLRPKGLKKVVFGILGIQIILLAFFFSRHSFNERFYYELVCLNSFIQTLYIVLYFYELNKRQEYIKLLSEPMFWFSTGLLLYSVCTFFVFLFYFKINSYFSKSALNNLWQIHHVCNFLMYLFFAIGIIKENQQKSYAQQ